MRPRENKAYVRTALTGNAVRPGASIDGDYAVSTANSKGSIIQGASGCARVRPSEYITDAIITAIGHLQNIIQARGLASFTLSESLGDTAPAQRAAALTETYLTTEADSSATHYALAASAFMMTTGAESEVSKPHEIENYIMMGTMGNATVRWSAKSASAFHIEPEASAGVNLAASGLTESAIGLPGDTYSDRLRTLGDMDGGTLGDYDSMTLQEADWIVDGSGDERIDPIIIHNGGA